MTLVPCAACARHVRSHEVRCPFCQSAIAPIGASLAEPTLRLGRAAMFAFRTSAALALGACGTNAPPPTTSAPPPMSDIAQPYGAPPDPRPEPPPTTSVETPPPTTTTDPVPPPTDVPSAPISEHPHHRRPVDHGSVHALYGAPIPAYGAAPPDGLGGIDGLE